MIHILFHEKNEQIKQIESEIGDSYAKTLGKLKGEKKVLKQQYEAKVSELEKTTIDKKTFEELLSKKDRIIEDLTNKLISYDKDQEIKLQKTLEVMEAKKAGEYDQKLKPYYRFSLFNLN